MNRLPRPLLLLLGTLGCLLPMLACGFAATPIRTPMTQDSPSWACPSPTPLPWGEAGPVKESRSRPTVTPVGPVEDEDTYYAAWEREYGPGGSLLDGQPAFRGPPFPAPTPYGLLGSTFSLGQRVKLPPLYALVTVANGPRLTEGQVYVVTIAWHNPTLAAVPIDYAQQVVIRSLSSDGRILTGNGWFLSRDALTAVGQDSLPTTIPVGDSTVQVPIVAPVGVVESVEVRLIRPRQFAPQLPTPTIGTGTPTPTPATATPTVTVGPNTDLRAPASGLTIVQWVRAAHAGPPCDHPGVLTDWTPPGDVAGGGDVGILPPGGASRVVQIALQQVGKGYVWGDEGPDTFDCSGLMHWSYAQVGLTIPRVAHDQYAGLRHIQQPELQPGDLIFFVPAGAHRISHVAMYIGDGAVIHAMSPAYGIRTTPAIFANRFYNGPGCSLCMYGFATVR
jgi:cell wall-associated NlpC family hydrolase